MQALKIFGKICLWIGISVVSEGVFFGIKNLIEGKDFLGTKKVEPTKTYVDYKGDVIMGKNDYEIA